MHIIINDKEEGFKELLECIQRVDDYYGLTKSYVL